MSLFSRICCLLFMPFLFAGCGGTQETPANPPPVLIEDLTFTDPALEKCLERHLTYVEPQAKWTHEVTRLKCGYEYEVRSLVDLALFSNLDELIVNKLLATSIDVSSFERLTYLLVDGSVEIIQIADHAALESLVVHSQLVTRVELARLPALKNLSLSFGPGSPTFEVDSVPRLEELYLSNFKDVAFDFRKLKSLRSLQIYDGELENFDASLLPDLEVLMLSSWFSPAIDVSENAKLKVFSCVACSIGGVTFSQNNLIETLTISNTPIQQIRLPSAENLAELTLHYNALLNKVELPEVLPKLKVARLEQNQLTELPTAQWPELERLSVNYNALSSLSLLAMPKVKSVSAVGNRLERADVTSAGALNTLELSNNLLTELDLSANQALVWLTLNNNALAHIEVHSPLLEHLNVAHNDISQLALSHLKKLVYLNAADNQLNTVDIEELAELHHLYLSGNNLASFAFNPAAPIGDLDLSHNQLSVLDLSYLDISVIFELKANNNQLTEFKFPELGEEDAMFIYRVDLSHNQLPSLNLAQGAFIQEAIFNNNPLAALTVDSTFGWTHVSSLDISDTALNCELFSNLATVQDLHCGIDTQVVQVPEA